MSSATGFGASSSMRSVPTRSPRGTSLAASMSSHHEAPDSGRAYRVLRHRDYRLLWSAELVSTLGRQMQQVAIAWQVFRLTGDPLQLGLLGLFRFLPAVIFGLAGGVVADRRDRRQTLLVTQLVLMATLGILALLTLQDAVAMPVIYAITFFSTTVGAIAGPTRQALLPALVPRRELAGAMSLTILSGQVAAVSGPALGGFVIAQFGVAATYSIDAATFLAVIGAV